MLSSSASPNHVHCPQSLPTLLDAVAAPSPHIDFVLKLLALVEVVVVLIDARGPTDGPIVGRSPAVIHSKT